jgi:hypothetical protein
MDIMLINLFRLFLVFLAKMIQSNSELLQIFSGLYTFGHPKIADNEFAKTFSPRMSSKIFHHAYNNGKWTKRMVLFLHLHALHRVY